MAILRKCDRYGIEAILGRKWLSYQEIRRFEYVDDFIHAYNARNNDPDGWAQWDADNPAWGAELNRSLGLVESDTDG